MTHQENLVDLARDLIVRPYKVSVKAPNVNVEKFIIVNIFGIGNCDKDDLSFLVYHWKYTFPIHWIGTRDVRRLRKEYIQAYRNISSNYITVKFNLTTGRVGQFIMFMLSNDCLPPWMTPRFARKTKKVKRMLQKIVDVYIDEQDKEHELIKYVFDIKLAELNASQWQRISGIASSRIFGVLNDTLIVVEEFCIEHGII